MQTIKQYLNNTVKTCIQNFMYFKTASAYKRLADINGLKNVKQNEIQQLTHEKVKIQTELETHEIKPTEHLKNNRLPLINKINALDNDIDEIEALLLNLEEEKRNIQYEILLLSNVRGCHQSE
ncbi:hypothetical protein ROU88_08685 [Macrococcus capreoli]|uniref:hypothetical protein n=1 Tax=Macrococcus capreoli TaxID=2982690 RepID=UPI0021D569E8|nr:hypothetical protein [Macrococcus sp. TMW 2.2395]MCU7557787.1 hypothetical protein [Macrococcus sp. TMW 2.2395]